jgi:hypothetical protein
LIPTLKPSTILVAVTDSNGQAHHKKVTSYDFPDLDTCRTAFEKRLGGKIDWDDLNAPASPEPM